ncbi:MAG TPA: aromatic ring-hydroxylating dioxygenase subunit alpha [Rhodoblastus sp.]|nr:aromatic ring-hydroxylating dioxygenase subunit alpha [Rhodoblastus sp.]
MDMGDTGGMPKETAPSAEAASARDIRKTAIDPDFWYPVAASRDVKQNRPFATAFAGDPIVLFRGKGGQVFALEDRCAHRQVPLSNGVIDGDNLRCGYHGWAFDQTGRCVSLPYDKGSVPGPRGVKTYPCRERYGLIFVFPGDAAKADSTPFPEIPAAENPAYKTRYLNRRANCHYSFMHENLMDMNHQFLHRKLMGSIKTLFLGASSGPNWAEAIYTFRRVGGHQHIGEKLILGRGGAFWKGDFWKTREAPADAPPPPDPATCDRMVIRTDYPHQTLRFFTAGATEPALDLWICYIPVDRDQKINHTFGMIMIRRPGKRPWLIDAAWPGIIWFTNGIFAEDKWICELEQAAFDAQGEDRNQEVFPAIRNVRRVLVECGVGTPASPKACEEAV